MKKVLVLLAAFGVLMLGMGTAGAGNSGALQPAKGIGADVICDGTPFTVSGIVVEIGIPGEGIVIDTGSGVITVYGIGSADFWAANSIARPAIGEGVTVTGYTVELTDRTINVAMSITVGGVTLLLRDPDTCAPLWRPAS